LEQAMPTSWISFGPDLEPLESESRRGARAAGPRRDGISVSGSAEEVATKLIEAAGASAAWCRFEQVLEDSRRRPIFLNGSAVRLVIEEA
jgi:hypothetical protein